MNRNLHLLKNLKNIVLLRKLIAELVELQIVVDTSTRRRWWVRPINQMRTQLGDSHQLISEMRSQDDEEFFKYTRCSIQQFDRILGIIKESILKIETRSDVISPETRLLVTLRYLATGASFKTLQYAFRIGHSTIAYIIYETCEAIINKMKALYLPQLTKEKLLEISNGFQRRTKYPNIVGAIDVKHVNIKAPKNSGTTYYNYKKNYSIVLLAVCDADNRFTYVNVGGYGSQSDGGIFKLSNLGKILENKEFPLPEPTIINGNSVPYFLLGDAAFPLKPYLMTPYSGHNIDEDKFVHNKELSKGRVCIENTFGILAARWQIFLNTLTIIPENADKIVMATILLHNFLMAERNNSYCSQGYADGEWRQDIEGRVPFLNSLPPSIRLGSRNATIEANNIRNIIKFFLNQTTVTTPVLNN